MTNLEWKSKCGPLIPLREYRLGRLTLTKVTCPCGRYSRLFVTTDKARKEADAHLAKAKGWQPA
jgi:hypothetical protein